MSINLTDEIDVKTKKGKLGAAKQIFLEGDTQTVEKEIQDINSRHNTLNTKHESLSRTVQGIAVTGGASAATNVTYNNDASGLNAENSQDAIDELQVSKIDKTSILQESGESEDKVMSQKATTTAIADETTRAKAAEEAIIFDVSASNDGVVFESLQALLGSSNLDTIIPVLFRHGGMTIRFIQGSKQSSYNKYAQYRLMANTFSTNEDDWQGVDDEPTAGSENLVKSGGVANKLAELEDKVDDFFEIYWEKNTSKYKTAGTGSTIVSSVEGNEVTMTKSVQASNVFCCIPLLCSRSIFDVNVSNVVADDLSGIQVSIAKSITDIAIQDYINIPFDIESNTFNGTFDNSDESYNDSYLAIYMNYKNKSAKVDLRISNQHGYQLKNSIIPDSIKNDIKKANNTIDAIIEPVLHIDTKDVKIVNNNPTVSVKASFTDNRIVVTKDSAGANIFACIKLVDVSFGKTYRVKIDNVTSDDISGVSVYTADTPSSSAVQNQVLIGSGKTSYDFVIDNISPDKIENTYVCLYVNYKASNASADVTVTEVGEVGVVGKEHISNEIYEGLTVNNWNGKKILAIGDSMTVGGQWVKRVAELLGMTYRVHAKGGISAIAMVDGDGSGDVPPSYDPDTGAGGTLYKLSASDVADVDVIVAMGFYNERSYLPNKGLPSDAPTTDRTSMCGRLNYVVQRIYEELANANNMKCKVILCSAHRYGKYSWIDKTAYDDGEDLFDVVKGVSDYHSLHLIDLMHNGGVNKYNWNIWQATNTPFNSKYITADGSANDGTNKPFDSLASAPSASANNGKYITVQGISGCYLSNGTNWVANSAPAPWNSDQLHLNNDGFQKIGEVIAGELMRIM